MQRKKIFFSKCLSLGVKTHLRIRSMPRGKQPTQNKINGIFVAFVSYSFVRVFLSHWPFACILWFLILSYYGFSVCVCFLCFFFMFKIIVFLFACLFYEEKDKRKGMELCVEVSVEKLGRTKGREILIRVHSMKSSFNQK